jgi:hypothetical protein
VQNQRKLIFLGSFKIGSTNISQARAFRDIGWDVIEYDFIARLKILKCSANRDEEIIQTCYLEDPQLVLISKGVGISADCIRSLNQITRTVLWYMDPLDDNWNDDLFERIASADIVACALFRPYRQAKKLNPSSFFVHEGFDSAVDFPIDQPKKWDVSFIGQPKGRRAIYQIAIGFKVIQGAFSTDHARAVGQSRINLNFVVNNSGCSDRVYKVLAAGGFLLTEDWPGRSEDFIDGEHLVIFSGLADLDQKIRWYLSANEDREMVAKKGKDTVQRFSRKAYAKRITELFLKFNRPV